MDSFLNVFLPVQLHQSLLTSRIGENGDLSHGPELPRLLPHGRLLLAAFSFPAMLLVYFKELICVAVGSTSGMVPQRGGMGCREGFGHFKRLV